MSLQHVFGRRRAELNAFGPWRVKPRLNGWPGRGIAALQAADGDGSVDMFRALFRLIGVIFLAAGFILLMYDGAKSIADSRIYLYKLGQLWTDINVASLQAAQARIQASLPGFFWDPVFTTVLNQPSWLILGIIGTLFILMGRKRKPLIGYAR
jgi:hypothetical protein